MQITSIKKPFKKNGSYTKMPQSSSDTSVKKDSDDHYNLIQFFGLLLEIDQKQNPKNYHCLSCIERGDQ